MDTITDTTVTPLPHYTAGNITMVVTVDWEWSASRYVLTLPDQPYTPDQLLQVIKRAIPRDEGASVTEVQRLV